MLNQTIEREIIEGAGHEMGCWEWNVELIIEAAAQAGTTLEGRHDEIFANKTLIDLVIDGLTAGRLDCYCEDQGEE
jgi:hypothetical protein